jgi:hypothetical protein
VIDWSKDMTWAPTDVVVLWESDPIIVNGLSCRIGQADKDWWVICNTARFYFGGPSRAEAIVGANSGLESFTAQHTKDFIAQELRRGGPR